MSHHCPFPVRSNDSRCGYHASSIPGLSLCLAIVAALTCFADLSYAEAVGAAHAEPIASANSASLAPSTPQLARS